MDTSVVVLRLRRYEDPVTAAAVLEAIQEAGEIRYTAADGTTDVAYVASAGIELGVTVSSQ